MHWGDVGENGVLAAPFQEEGVAIPRAVICPRPYPGYTGINKRDMVAFDLYDEVLEEGILAVGFISTVGRALKCVAFQADCSVTHEFQNQFICLEGTEGDFGTLPESTVESVNRVALEYARAKTQNSHDPKGHSCRFVSDSFHGTVC